jgi:hypothetical protein
MALAPVLRLVAQLADQRDPFVRALSALVIARFRGSSTPVANVSSA